MNQQFRSAIVLSGLVHRSLQHTIESLRRHVIAPLELLGGVDIFYHSWNPNQINNPRTGEHEFEIDPQSIQIYLPEARGFFESQDEFDLTLDLKALSQVNPMRQFTRTDDAALSTLKNYLRAMESLERAWQFFDENKNGIYNRVVVTRSDLRFLNDLSIPDFAQIRSCLADDFEGFLGQGQMVSDSSLCLPSFQSWKGVNDRFAIGSESDIEIYCRRSRFAIGCILAGKMWNPESILKEWLRVNRVRIDFLDIVFQRVRADGSSPAQDLGLSASSGFSNAVNSGVESIKDNHYSKAGEHFVITAETAGEKSENLMDILHTLGTVELVECAVVGSGKDSLDVAEFALDGRKSKNINNFVDADLDQTSPNHFSDDDLFQKEGNFDPLHLTKTLLHLSNKKEKGSAVWIVNEFVAGGVDGFALLVKETALRGADFAVYDAKSLETCNADHKSGSEKRGVNRKDRLLFPLMRISARLLDLILDQFLNTEGFESVESIIHTIAFENGMKCISWRHIGETRGHFVVYQKNIAISKPVHGLVFPVIDPVLHKAICRLPLSEFPRLSQVSPENPAISLEDYVFIKRYCDFRSINRVVEIGPGNQTLALLDAGCTVISFERDATRLADAFERFPGEANLELRHIHLESFDEIVDRDLKAELVVIGSPFDVIKNMESHRSLCESALKLCGRVILLNARDYLQSEMADFFSQLGMDVIRIPTKFGLAIITDSDRNDMLIGDISQKFVGFDIFKEIWGIDSVYAFTHLFQVKEGACKVLHIGASDGLTAIFMLSHIFTCEESQFHCIDMYDGEEGGAQQVAFSQNAANAGRTQQIHLYEGQSSEILAWMIASDGYWQSFDFAILNCPNGLAGDQLANACQTWMLLKPGGIMVWASDGRAGEIDAFIEAFGRRAEVMLAGRQIFVRKVR